MEEALLKEKIHKAKRLVFLGGAGVSVPSGIPDFRSPDGLYSVRSEYGVDYQTLLSHDYFFEYPDRFYSFYWKSMVHLKARPNSAHQALADFERAGHKVTILTQNIDGLHQMSGSKDVVELHGSVHRYYCSRCAKRYSIESIPHEGVPHCSCGGIIKPAVTLFGEPLPSQALSRAIEEIHKADVLLVGGTSLKVYPAAGLIEYFIGGLAVYLGLEAPLRKIFDEVVIGDISLTLKELLQ